MILVNGAYGILFKKILKIFIFKYNLEILRLNFYELK